MKSLTITFVLIFYPQIFTEKTRYRSSSTAWINYKNKYNLYFNESEDVKRRSIFEKNILFIRQHNAKNAEFTVSLNHLVHLDNNEMNSAPTIIIKNLPAFTDNGISILDDPNFNKSVDWRKREYIPSIRDQLSCAGCYAFPTADAIQSNFAIKGRKVSDLSHQAIIDCSSKEGNKGCHGGSTTGVFEYAKKHGLPKASDYPYIAKAGDCHAKKYKPECFVSSYVKIEYGDENAIINAIKNGYTVVLAIDASSQAFRFYSNGIFVYPQCKKHKLNHDVLAVGYELNAPIPYLIVKNSWGKFWGKSGYIYMPIFKHNQCGIATRAAYPIPKLS